MLWKLKLTSFDSATGTSMTNSKASSPGHDAIVDGVPPVKGLFKVNRCRVIPRGYVSKPNLKFYEK